MAYLEHITEIVFYFTLKFSIPRPNKLNSRKLLSMHLEDIGRKKLYATIFFDALYFYMYV
jgi:hypothetical protein